MTDPMPWLRHYGDVPAQLDYPAATLFEALRTSALRSPQQVALEFAGRGMRFASVLEQVERCAAGLAAIGLRAGERITIAMPTLPQGVIAFYAAIRLGAVPAMLHPLSTSAEIEFALNAAHSRYALTLDAFVPAFAAVRARTPLEHLVVASIGDVLAPWQRLAVWWSRGRRLPRLPDEAWLHRWHELMAGALPAAAAAAQLASPASADDVAVILYSGGTTGRPKGILLSHRNVLACSMQVIAWGRIGAGDAVLAILPLFHGFGLAVCVNAALLAGGRCILVPQFTARDVARIVRQRQPNLLVGVPTLFESLTREPDFLRADLSGLRGAFSGADTLPRPVKERFESVVRERGGAVRLLEGYGLTEAVSACMAMPLHEYREGSVGVPFPDMRAKICAPGSTDEVADGVEGEICIAGPSVMLGYMDAPEETAATLRRHADGRTRLHTGDLGRRDADGFFYFSCRLKRMIKSSGFNVYPAQVEAVLYRHPAVLEACVVGVPDAAQVERVIAFVAACPGSRRGGARGRADRLVPAGTHQVVLPARDRVPRRALLPRVGKIDFAALRAAAVEQRAAAQRAAAGGPNAGEAA
ncbi:MAG: AMP-binding protein [Steroidobacteraceae bacterium]